MNRNIIALILIATGIWLFVVGWSRKDSFMGSLAETGTTLANRFDGGARTPRHTLYLGGSVLLIAGGLVLIFTGRAKT